MSREQVGNRYKSRALVYACFEFNLSDQSSPLSVALSITAHRVVYNVMDDIAQV